MDNEGGRGGVFFVRAEYNAGKGIKFLQAIKQQLHPTGIQRLGPAPAPLARKANYRRMQLLIQAPSRIRREQVLKSVHEAIRQHQLDKNIEWTLDIVQ
jgi:primosomal protein N' (replication factor Y)